MRLADGQLAANRVLQVALVCVRSCALLQIVRKLFRELFRWFLKNQFHFIKLN